MALPERRNGADGDSRGNMGLMMQAIALLRPDIAAEMSLNELTSQEALKRFFQKDEEP